ncbi:MAG: hypothetical protein AB7P03_02750 [Kofleriaceae bacterium]
MKTLNNIVALAAMAGAGAGCNWTEFDDVADTTWVSIVERPDEGDSSSFPLAVAAVNNSSDMGGTFMALGAENPQLFTLAYDSTGSYAVTPSVLLSMFGGGAVEDKPILLSDPASDQVVLVQAVGLIVTKPEIAHRPGGWGAPDGGTFAVLGGETSVLVADNSTVSNRSLAEGAAPTPCMFNLGGGTAPIRALGAARSVPGPNDDTILVWTSDGELVRYDASVFSACNSAPTGKIATSFTPSRGAEIHVIDDHIALLVGSDGSRGFLGLYDVAPAVPTLIGAPIMPDGVTTAAIIDIDAASAKVATDAGRYVVAGMPRGTADGVAEAGRVELFKLTDQGLEGPKFVLHDARPEANQAFGRSVTVMRFNGRPIIVVADGEEAFVYHQTLLYQETRQGR